MNRRTVLAGLGAGATVLLPGCTVTNELSRRMNPSVFTVSIANRRDTGHEIFVETDLDGVEAEYGPRTVEPEDSWYVERFQTRAELFVRVHVDGEVGWSDAYEIPLPTNRPSDLVVELRSDGEVEAVVWTDD